MRKESWQFSFVRLIAAALILTVSSGAASGQKKKKADNSASPAAGSNDSNSIQSLPKLPTSAADEIDHDIGEMLAAFELGDVEAMHKYYADNATFVSSDYAPPVVGWQNYAALYRQQRAAFQGMQLIRRNTFIFPHGDVAWASYQWEFNSELNGRAYSIRGQTTLVLNKVGDHWLIVHNHSSVICPANGFAPQQPAAPSKP